MKKRKNYFILTLFIIANIFLFVGSIYIFQKQKAESISRELSIFKKYFKVASKINETWREGDLKRDWKSKRLKCKKLGNDEVVSDEFTRCNGVFLNCYLENKKFHFNDDISIIAKIKAHKLNKIIVNITSKNDNNGGIDITLENNCHETYLPRRNYGHALGIKNERVLEWRFDNFKRHIYIDKFLVSNFEINHWVNLKNKKIRPSDNPATLSHPATHLSSSEMIEYCADKKKQLLTAQFFDAATIHPGDLENKKQKLSLLYPYPWARNKKNVFLNRIIQGEKLKMSGDMCRKCYTKECLKKYEFISYDTKASTWMGINQTLGGYQEYVHNPLNPKRNLVLSSMLFLAKSKVHKLGQLGFWNGKNSALSKVGFRCMREVIE